MQQSRSPGVSHWLINQFNNKLTINEKGLHLINGANTFSPRKLVWHPVSRISASRWWWRWSRTGTLENLVDLNKRNLSNLQIWSEKSGGESFFHLIFQPQDRRTNCRGFKKYRTYLNENFLEDLNYLALVVI